MPSCELHAELCPVLPSSARGFGAGLELKDTEVSVSTVSQRLPFPKPDFYLACQAPRLSAEGPQAPQVGSSRGCDLGVGSEGGILEAAGFGMGRGGKRSHLLSTLEAPPLGGGGLEIVLVSICMCQCDSQCVCFLLLPWKSLYI